MPCGADGVRQVVELRPRREIGVDHRAAGRAAARATISGSR